jgi:diadenosine tetraphosphate (Ap4A) HIT family hydrolase
MSGLHPHSAGAAENSEFVAFIPHAALSPYHLWIFPKTHAACFSDQPALPALAEVLHIVLAKVHGMLANPPFNLVVRSLGPAEKDAPHFHWYIAIVPRVNQTAGFEMGTGNVCQSVVSRGLCAGVAGVLRLGSMPFAGGSCGAEAEFQSAFFRAKCGLGGLGKF